MEANGLKAKAEKAKVEAQLEDSSSSRRFTWKIESFSKLSVKKLYSDIFCVGGYKWRILIFPKGNKVDHLSVYLAVDDSVTLPLGWSRYALFSLSVINQIVSKYTITKESQHEFNEREKDWGFTACVALSELNDPARGFLVNDTCIVEVEIRLNKELGENELKSEEKRDSVAQPEPAPLDLQPAKAQLEPKLVDSRTIIPNTPVLKLFPTPKKLTQEQTTQVAVPLINTVGEPERVNLVAKTNDCPQAVTSVTFSTESSQQNEQVTLMAKDVQEEAKMTTTPATPLIVDPPSVQPPKEPTIVEAEIGSSYLSEYVALFTDIQNLLGGKSSETENLKSYCPRACNKEEIAHAKKFFKECLNMKLAGVIQSGRDLELKNSLSIILTCNACPDNMVNFTAKFLANFEQFAGAQQELREVQEKEKSIGEMEITMKRLASEFIPLRNQAEAVDQEIAELERMLTEKKAKKVSIRNSLEDLAGRATTSKQAFIDAQEVMRPLAIKKEQAEKMVCKMESSWELLKSGIP